MSCALIDIDFFKQFNDTYGHVSGDNCLIRIASHAATIAEHHRCFLARFGGEEFVVLMPRASLEAALVICREIMDAIHQLSIAHTHSLVEPIVTVSIGLTTQTANAEADSVKMLEQADRALYHAKQAGRNRIEVFAP